MLRQRPSLKMFRDEAEILHVALLQRNTYVPHEYIATLPGFILNLTS